MAPLLWTGLEFFRSELYFLRFSWLNMGYAFAWANGLPAFAWLGVYGIGLSLMTGASIITQLPPRRALITSLLSLTALGLLTHLPRLDSPSMRAREIRIAGLQLEFPAELELPTMLDGLRAKHPNADLYVLPEYTFQESVPKGVKAWCRRHQKYLLAGGKEPLNEEQFYNTAYVIDPKGEIVFKQAKAQPIQFFKDGLPAKEQLVWASPWGKLGICICYDLSYTTVVDKLVRQGAEAIFVPTMDVEAWGEYQHRLHARVGPVRVAEYRVPIFRLASSGISQIITSSGTVTQSGMVPGQGEMLAASLRLETPARLPVDRWLVWPAVAITAGIALWGFWLALWDRKRPSRKEQEPAAANVGRDSALS